MCMLEWLLGLDNIRLERDAPLLLKWGVELPAWVLVCLAIIALTWIVGIYRRERAPLSRKIVPAVLRAGLIALIVAVLCQPSLVLEQNRTEPSHVALLVDTSQSMATRDAYADVELAESMIRGAGLDTPEELSSWSRLDLVQAALLSNNAAALANLLERNGTRLCSFAATIEPRAFAGSPDALPTLVEQLQQLEPDGRQTDLAGALRRTIEEAPGRRLAAILLASDGQLTEPAGLSGVIELARGRKVPAFRSEWARRSDRSTSSSVRSALRIPSLSTTSLPSTRTLSAYGIVEATPVTLRLIDDRSGAVVASQEVTLDPDATAQGVELRFKPTRTGQFRYRVEADKLPLERTVANNAALVDLTVVDDHLRVLYVDGFLATNTAT